MKRRNGESGYASVAAAASIAIFATLALATLTTTRTLVLGGRAEIDQAKAAAAADAGIALAIRGLLDGDQATRWSIDSRTRVIRFQGDTLAIRIEDERGKVPINHLDEHTMTTLLEAEGLSGDRLLTARDSLLDWLDEDNDARPFGAEADDYAAAGIRPRNDLLVSLDELGEIHGFDPALVARIKRVATVSSESGAFDPHFAQPLAAGIMTGDGADSPEAIDRARELAGQRPAFALADTVDLIDRPVTIIVDVKSEDGAHARRSAVVKLTGKPLRPYVINSYG